MTEEGDGRHPVSQTWGYTNRFSVRAGESLQLMVSSTAEALSASVVRLGRLDFIDGVTHVAEDVEGIATRRWRGALCDLRPGSYVSVALQPVGGLGLTSGFTLTAWVCPALAPSDTRWLMNIRSQAADGDIGLGLCPNGSFFSLGGARVASGTALRTNQWYFLAGTWASTDGRAVLLQVPARGWPGTARTRTEATTQWSPRGLLGELTIGARSPGGRSMGHLEGFFNGKIDEPAMFARALSDEELDRLAAGDDPARIVDISGTWTFLPTGRAGVAIDRSRNERHGRIVNLPTTAVTGHRWTGDHVSWPTVPGQYSAVALHEDDLEDARWPVAAEFTMPVDQPSGIYAVRLRGDDGSSDEVPFFVTPAVPAHDVLFLAPTFTYLAYANDHWTSSNPAMALAHDASKWLSEADRFAASNHLLSLYDHHADDSGVCFASRLRPLVNVRPDHVSADVRGRRELSADLFLTDWLTATGTGYDVATDDDLHAEGAAVLEPYRVVVTGSHPEYCTAPMLDALEEYVNKGGRLMYLGGNGFYWVTTVGPERDYVIEVRRGHAGSGTWRSAPGEGYHSHTGEPGGLWRHRGRPPQRLVGVGMTAIGLGQARPFHRAPGSFSPSASWIFEDIGCEPIGDHGYVLGGAAGIELDRADGQLGTPENTLVLATATGFDDTYQGVVEDVMESNSRQGGTVCPLVRADMTYFQAPNKGAVFAVGSITWSGALAHNHYQNPVSRITGNVLAGFRREQLGYHELTAGNVAKEAGSSTPKMELR